MTVQPRPAFALPPDAEARVPPEERGLTLSATSEPGLVVRGHVQLLALALSNLAIVDPKTGEATRVGFRVENGRKVRFAKKSGEKIDV